MNVLFVCLDQFRGDSLGVAGHAQVRTPHIDAIANEGVFFARHYGQATPCSPGRASLYTGMYQFNHRVVGNGTPLDARFDNVAQAARRAGYTPTLFGYTDQSIDPREADGPDDPRLSSYEGVLPGFDVGFRLAAGRPAPWIEWLKSLGYALPDDPMAVLAGESSRPAEQSMCAFLTDRFIEWLRVQDRPWFAHLSHFRPHEPYAAAGHYAQMYDPAAMPAPIAKSDQRHPLHDRLLMHPLLKAPEDPQALAEIRAQYYGMITEADAQLGRVVATLKHLGQWDDTLIVLTSDHADQLGDHGLVQKFCYFEQSFHIPAVIRDPRRRSAGGRIIADFTESIDLFPTLCEAMGVPIPAQCDGISLMPYVRDEAPPWTRDAVHWEFDWRFDAIPKGEFPWPWDRRLEQLNLMTIRSRDWAYVHFADGTFLCFDLAKDPTWRTEVRDRAIILEAVQALATFRAQHNERTLSSMLVENGGIGRWPPMPAQWGQRGE